ncbi:MAG TPA: polyphenol oxidase family protein [Thermoanaerobaculia bacterium]|nr:polyphenol oxidase family protein [Thermoanaerobaculia bacterium]
MDGHPATRATSGATSGGGVSRLSLPGAPGFAAGFTRGARTARALDPDLAGRALAKDLGAPDAEVIRLTQVHGRGTLTFEEPPRERRNLLLGEGDAAITCQPNVLLAVATADCVPIVLADPVRGWIAAIHAGWRGTALRVLDAALDALDVRGVSPRDLSAAFGPSIARDRYEVGPEVVAALLDAYGAPPEGAVAPGAGGKAFVDVAAFNEATLLARGVDPARIHRPHVCNAAEPDLPSWRRDGPGAGRILTGVVRPPA